MAFGLKPEVFGGKKKKNPILRYNDFVWDSVIGSPLRGAKNIGNLVKKAGKHSLKVITRSDYPDDFTFEKAKEMRRKRLAKKKSETEAREKTDEYIKRDKGKDKKKDSPKADKPEAGGKTEPTKVERSEKARWIKKTRNSPAAQSGAFTDDERWALQQRHRAWKDARKKKKR